MSASRARSFRRWPRLTFIASCISISFTMRCCVASTRHLLTSIEARLAMDLEPQRASKLRTLHANVVCARCELLRLRICHAAVRTSETSAHVGLSKPTCARPLHRRKMWLCADGSCDKTGRIQNRAGANLLSRATALAEIIRSTPSIFMAQIFRAVIDFMGRMRLSAAVERERRRCGLRVCRKSAWHLSPLKLIAAANICAMKSWRRTDLPQAPSTVGRKLPSRWILQSPTSFMTDPVHRHIFWRWMIAHVGFDSDVRDDSIAGGYAQTGLVIKLVGD